MSIGDEGNIKKYTGEGKRWGKGDVEGILQ